MAMQGRYNYTTIGIKERTKDRLDESFDDFKDSNDGTAKYDDFIWYLIDIYEEVKQSSEEELK